MKKFVVIVVTIATMFAFAFAIADCEQLGGHDEDGFIEFVNNAELEEPTYYAGKAYQRVFFDNGYHISAECDYNEDSGYADTTEMIVDVYDATGWVVGDRYIIEHSDDGEQKFWDLCYSIYNGEL